MLLTNKNDTHHSRHCVFLLHVHLVFVTKYRRKIFDQDAIERLHHYFKNTSESLGIELVEMNGENDHVHL